MNRISKIAITELDLAADTGQPFTLDTVEDEVFKQIKDLGLEDEELRDLCHQKVAQIDRSRHAGATGQLDLLTGEDATLDQILVIGKNQRIKKRNATMPQWLNGRALEQSVFADQAIAEAKKAKIDAALTEVWISHPKWTYEQVLNAYRKTLPPVVPASVPA